MSKIATYAPVAVFQLHDIAGTVSGFAAPKRGLEPCLIKLSSDNAPIAFGRATRLDAVAASRGLRRGWCGFDLPGLRQAFAIGDDVRLSCGVTGDTLAQLPFDPALFRSAPPSPRTLTPLDLVRLARSGEMCEDMDELIPFAVAHYHVHGPRAFIEASYQTLLKRWPDGAAAGIDQTNGETVEIAIAAFLDCIVESDEYLKLWGVAIPGPFHHAFRYDRSLLD